MGRLGHDIATGPQSAAQLCAAEAPVWFGVRGSSQRAPEVRLWLLLGALWLMNGVDLSLTLQASCYAQFREANPLAAHILHNGPDALILFKVAMVTLATVIFVMCQRSRILHSVIWIPLAAYVAVSVKWMWCLEGILDSVTPIV